MRSLGILPEGGAPPASGLWAEVRDPQTGTPYAFLPTGEGLYALPWMETQAGGTAMMLHLWVWRNRWVYLGKVFGANIVAGVGRR